MELNSNNPGRLYNSDNIEKILIENDPAVKELQNRYKFSIY